MPERQRMAGEPMAPAASTTRRLRSTRTWPSGPSTSTPATRPAGDEQAAGQELAEHHQVGPDAGRGQVADGGRDPQPAQLVHRLGPDAGSGRVVGVGARRMSEAGGGLDEGGVDGMQLAVRVAADGDRPGVAVKGPITEVEVAFQPAEGGQHPGPRPLVVAQRRPAVVVLGHAPQSDAGVHRAGSAGDPTSGEGGLTAVGAGQMTVGPVVGHVGVVVAVAQVVGGVGQQGVVGAGVDQQHRAVGVLTGPGGHHRAGGPGADHDHVVVGAQRVGEGRGAGHGGILASAVPGRRPAPPPLPCARGPSRPRRP